MTGGFSFHSLHSSLKNREARKEIKDKYFKRQKYPSGKNKKSKIANADKETINRIAKRARTRNSNQTIIIIIVMMIMLALLGYVLSLFW